MSAKTEVMTPGGIVTLSEFELVEVLETLCRRIDLTLEDKSDASQADALELIGIYNKLNIGCVHTHPRSADPELELSAIVGALRTPQSNSKSRKGAKCREKIRR